jgi:hypothetical protein
MNRSDKLKALKEVLKGKKSIQEILDVEPSEEVFFHRPATDTFTRQRTNAIYTEAKLRSFGQQKPNARRTIFFDTTFKCPFSDLTNAELRERFKLREEETAFSMAKSYEPEREAELLAQILKGYENEILESESDNDESK